MELMAALLCVETGQFIQREMGIRAEQIFCWSDSEITLWWIEKKPDLLIPFVANRVEKIQHSKYPFAYINTKDNSADIASRGCTPEDPEEENRRRGGSINLGGGRDFNCH